MELSELVIGNTYRYWDGGIVEYKGESLKIGKYLFSPHPLPNSYQWDAPENGGVLLTEQEIKERITNAK
jgi:hypothetical protein